MNREDIDPNIYPGRLCVTWKELFGWRKQDTTWEPYDIKFPKGEILLMLSRHESVGWTVLTQHGQFFIYGLGEVILIESAKDYGIEV